MRNVTARMNLRSRTKSVIRHKKGIDVWKKTLIVRDSRGRRLRLLGMVASAEEVRYRSPRDANLRV